MDALIPTTMVGATRDIRKTIAPMIIAQLHLIQINQILMEMVVVIYATIAQRFQIQISSILTATDSEICATIVQQLLIQPR